MSETTEAASSESVELPAGIVEWVDEEGFTNHGAEDSLAYRLHRDRVESAERAEAAEKEAAEKAAADAAAAAEKELAEKTAATAAAAAADAEKADAAGASAKAETAKADTAKAEPVPASVTSTGRGRIAGPPAS